MRWRPLACSLAAGLWLTAGAAHGQQVTQLRPSLDEAEQVPPAPVKRRRVVDPYAPDGLRMGGLRLYASLTDGTVFTSNVRQTSSQARSAVGLRLQPSLRFESDWVRHSWTGEAHYDAVHYLDNGDLTSHQADLFSKVRLDIRRDTRVEFDAVYNLDQAGLGDSEVPASAVGYRTEHRIEGAAALIHDFGRIETRVKGDAGLKLYDDVKLSGGGTEDNADRDYVNPSLSFRTTYTDPPIFKPYLQAAYEPRYYLKRYDRNGLQRSSQGLAASAGVVVGEGPFWSGDIAAMYLWRDYDDAALDNDSAVGLTGRMTWSPDEISKITLAAETSLVDAISTRSSSNRDWVGRIDVARGVRDNVNILAGAGIEVEETESGDDITYDANLGLEWKLGPSLAWTAGYDVTWLDATTTGRSYTEHRLSAGLTLSR